MKINYIVSTVCDVCKKRGRKCVELGSVNACVCSSCMEGFICVLDSIKRRVTTKEDLA